MIGRVAIALAVLAEALIVYCLAELFAAGYGTHVGAIPAVSWAFLGLVAFATPRLTEHFGLGERTRIAISIATAYVAIAAVMRIEFAGDVAIWDFDWARRFVADIDQTSSEAGPVVISLFLIVALWARCTYRSAQDVDLEGMPRAVVPGFVGVTTLVVLGAMTDRTGEIARAASAFYAVAVLALAFSQMGLSGTSFGDLRAGGFAGSLMGGVLGVTIAGVVLFTVTFGLIWPTISPLFFGLIAGTVTVIFTPPAWLLTTIFEFLFRVFGVTEVSIQPPDLYRTVSASPESDQSTGERVAGIALRATALLAVLGLAAVAAVIFSAFRKKASRPARPGPERAAAGSLGEDVRDLLRNLFRRDRPPGQALPDNAVFRLYADVLQQAQAAGRAREPAETPVEFAPVVAARLHRGPVTDEITRAFIEVRYAGRSPDESAVAELERRWTERALD